MAERTPPEHDPRSVDELFADALTDLEFDRDDERYTRAVSALLARSSREILDHAIDLTTSTSAEEREVGVQVIREIRDPSLEKDTDNFFFKRGFVDETVALLTDLSNTETDIDVLASIAIGFGHRRDPRGLESLLRLATHDHEDVRYTATCALPSCFIHQGDDDPPLEPEASFHNSRIIGALMERCEDEDGDVRDWAIFGVAQLTTDPPGDPEWPGIRELFAAHLDDDHDDAREEAISALASLRDPRAIPALLASLEDEDTWPGRAALEGATALADPILLPALLALRDEGFESLWLPDAIAACTAPLATEETDGEPPTPAS